MEQGFQVLLQVFGGLALFLYGTDSLCRAVQQGAGRRLRGLLARCTANPVAGLLTGAAVTAVLQSSSAVTVMVIAFLAAGLLRCGGGAGGVRGEYRYNGHSTVAGVPGGKLAVSAAVLRGAALSGLQKLAGPLRGRGGVRLWAAVRGRHGDAQRHGTAAAKPVAPVGACPGAAKPFAWASGGRLHDTDSTKQLCHSGAAAKHGGAAGADGVHSLLGLTAAIPILLGDNIGTTVTAVLAAIGQGRDAKRVAAAHAIFNLSGAAVCCALLQPFAALVRLCSPTGAECAVIARQIANAHTLFNGLCALVWLPLTRADGAAGLRAAAR